MKDSSPASVSSAASSSGQVLRAAGLMGIATFLSRILGLVREQVFAVAFGAGNFTDAFNIAFRIPNLLRDLFAEGALSAAFVPTFTRVRKERGERDAWRVSGLVFRILFLFVGALSIVGILFAPELVGLYAGAFRDYPGKFELTVLMTRIMFPFFPLVALAAAYMGILNACGRFFFPAFASALFNLASIVTGLAAAWFLPRFGYEPIVGMALGVLIGGAVQAFSQLPQLYQAGYRFPQRQEGDLPWHQEPAIRQMLLLMLPSMLGLAATQVNVLVNSILATGQGPGAVSWLNYAFRLMQFPIGIFGVSLAAATLPEISRRWVDQDHAGLRRTLTRSLQTVLAVNLPAAAGLAFLGVPIVQLIFEYGRFHAIDTASTAQALVGYSVGLGAYSAVKVLVPACYAVGRTRSAVVSSLLAVALTIGFNVLFVQRFSFVGLALGTSLAAIFNALYLMRVLEDLIDLRAVALSALSHLGIALLMGVSCLFLYRVLDRSITLPAGWESLMAVVGFRLLKTGVVIAFGGGVVLLAGRLLGIPESVEFSRWVIQKVRRKMKIH